MRVFIIDTSNMTPELRGGLIGVEGFSTHVMDGWAIAADLFILGADSSGEARVCGDDTPIGHLAAVTAETACVPFVNLTSLARGERTLRTAHV